MGQSLRHGTASATRPLVGVLCCNRALDGRAAQAVATRFLSPLSDIAGVSVLLVPALPGAVDVPHLARLLDGLLLTGSCSNLNAVRYGGAGDPSDGDDGRDEVALRLAGAMIETGRPVFGICRGLQEINVLFGGTLADHAGHHRGGDERDLATLFEHAHDVAVAPGGLLAAVRGAGPCRVNSVHRQGIDRLGRGLSVEAEAPDALVEAISARPCGAPVLGVQWHPEWDAAANPDSARFFELLGRAARGAAR